MLTLCRWHIPGVRRRHPGAASWPGEDEADTREALSAGRGAVRVMCGGAGMQHRAPSWHGPGNEWCTSKLDFGSDGSIQNRRMCRSNNRVIYAFGLFDYLVGYRSQKSKRPWDGCVLNTGCIAWFDCFFRHVFCGMLITWIGCMSREIR